jgi:hypothetical protein
MDAQAFVMKENDDYVSETLKTTSNWKPLQWGCCKENQKRAKRKRGQSRKGVFFLLFAVTKVFLSKGAWNWHKQFISLLHENAKTKQTSLDILFQSFISLKANFFESKNQLLSSSCWCSVAEQL